MNQAGDIRELIAFSALDNAVKDQNISICLRIKDKNILVQAFFDMQDLPNLQGHRLAGPLRRDLTEPTIWQRSGPAFGDMRGVAHLGWRDGSGPT